MRIRPLTRSEMTEAGLTRIGRPEGDLADPGPAEDAAAPIVRARLLIRNAVENPPCITAPASDRCMPRSALVDRVTDVMGLSPRRCILLQRMKVAGTQFSDRRLNKVRIAAQTGNDAPSSGKSA